MNYSTTVENIETVLDGVSGIGTTHNYFRHINNVTDQQSEFVSDSILNTWLITRVRVDSERYANVKIKRSHIFNIYGYYAVDDTNTKEKTFQGLIDSILDVLDSISNYNIASGLSAINSARVLEIDHVVWCNVLCYRVIIQYTVEEVIETRQFIYVMSPDGKYLTTPDGKKITIKIL